MTGIEATVIGLLPIRFLDGHKLFTWNRVLWGVLFVVGAFGMIHLLLRPGGGYFNHSGNTPMFTVIVLFVAFGVVSISFWAYFRYRKPRARACAVGAHRARPGPGRIAGNRPGTVCYHRSAGWSSPVARWAHNPEVEGSNPSPATNREAAAQAVGSPDTAAALGNIPQHFPATVQDAARSPATPGRTHRSRACRHSRWC